jgi:hypothetical protein
MPDLLTLVLAAVAIIVAGSIVAFLRRRRRAAADEAIVVASTPVPALSQDDIAWRIGVAGSDRPGGEEAAAAFAEPGAADASAVELPGPPPVRAAASPAPFVLAPPRPSKIVRVTPVAGRAPTPAPPVAPVAPAPGRAPTPAAPVTPPVAPASPHDDGDQPISRRYQLWRDSATVLLIACLILLALTVYLSGAGPGR